MCDIAQHLPLSELLNKQEYQPLLEAFENNQIYISDLLVSDIKDILSWCGRSISEVSDFIPRLISELEGEINEFETGWELSAEDKTHHLTSGDVGIDMLLGSGIPTGRIIEISGESASGKSQFLLQLACSVQLPLEMGGLARSAIYISTESGIETRRLLEIAQEMNLRRGVTQDALITADNVHCVTCKDLEEMEHVLCYQLPVAVERFNVGLVIIDSIAAHYRAEYEQMPFGGREQSVIKVTSSLRLLAEKHQLVVAVSNQVHDRVTTVIDEVLDVEPLYLDHQLRWFSGWSSPSLLFQNGSIKNDATIHSSPEQVLRLSSQFGPKNPALGLAWAYAIDARVVLKLNRPTDGEIERTMEMVYSKWCPPYKLTFQISTGGLSSEPDQG